MRIELLWEEEEDLCPLLLLGSAGLDWAGLLFMNLFWSMMAEEWRYSMEKYLISQRTVRWISQSVKMIVRFGIKAFRAQAGSWFGIYQEGTYLPELST